MNFLAAPITDGSTGRLNAVFTGQSWPRTHGGSKGKGKPLRQNGAVYTPSLLAQFVSRKLVELYRKSGAKRKSLRILDPACGDGALLGATVAALAASATRCDATLCGVDIDASAVAKARFNIRTLLHNRSRIGLRCSPKILQANALLPDPNATTSQGWTELRRKFDAGNGFDLIIANPPWGAAVEEFRHKLSLGDFTLLQKQFDTSDLFVELALSLLEPDGFLAFIVPDSLFSFERNELRRMLLKRTQIHYLGRLGEKFFGGVNRACAVLICKKAEPTKRFNVQCVRLTPEYRKSILAGNKTFEDAERSLGHVIPQSRFANNGGYRFDLDLKRDENRTISKLRAQNLTFRKLLVSTRGVELSKLGRVQRCDACDSWFPLQERSMSTCPHCGFKNRSRRAAIEIIINRQHTSKYLPIVVGESVSRYRLSAPYWINPSCSGINYKPTSIYRPPKLLVRKTGIGISACIDYSEALTNQVVYIFRLKPEYRNVIRLELLLALLNSRAMYYYLVKTYGETEWRSHPYVTQQQILDLPIPNLSALKTGEGDRIAAALRVALRRGDEVQNRLDSRIEQFVARSFGLGKADYMRIYDTLSSVERLLPIQTLLKVNLNDIFPARR